MGQMAFDVGEFSCAGGATAYGHSSEISENHTWLDGKVQRNANCRNCGFHLGWRYENVAGPDKCSSAKCKFIAHKLPSDPWLGYCCLACCRGGSSEVSSPE